jgi:DNA-binding transcriptional LysR family regulator
MTPDDAEWRLTGPEGTTDIAVRGLVSTNNHEAVRNATLNSLGIALLPEYLVADDLRAGRLKHVLPEYSSETAPAYVVYPSRQHLAPRTRVVIDFLVEEVRRLRAGRTDSFPSMSPLLAGTRPLDGDIVVAAV